MTMLLLITLGCLLFLLILTTGARPLRSTLSTFELRRRQKLRDKKAEEALRRETLLRLMGALKAPLSALLLISITAIAIYLLGFGAGSLVSTCVGLLYSRIAHIAWVRSLMTKLYARSESWLLRILSKHETKLRLISGKPEQSDKRVLFASREELEHVLDVSQIFSEEDKKLLKNTLQFKQRTVKEAMTPRTKIVTVEDTELLGPLLLHELHSTGHTIFPVMKNNTIIGLLDSSDHADLRTKESVHVRSVMHTDITKISQEATLDEAMSALIGMDQQLLVAVNDEAEMTGLISLKDIVRVILGR